MRKITYSLRQSQVKTPKENLQVIRRTYERSHLVPSRIPETPSTSMTREYRLRWIIAFDGTKHPTSIGAPARPGYRILAWSTAHKAWFYCTCVADLDKILDDTNAIPSKAIRIPNKYTPAIGNCIAEMLDFGYRVGYTADDKKLVGYYPLHQIASSLKPNQYDCIKQEVASSEFSDCP